MENLLIAKVKDALRLSSTTDVFKAVGFLTPAESALIRVMPELKGEKYAFYGGYEDAERVFFIALPYWCDDPEQTGAIESHTFTYRKCDKLSHRDFLGALMSLGITRECVGDILCEEGRTVVFTASSVSNYIFSQMEKVGNVGVKIESGFNYPLPGLSQLKEFTATIASLRLDNIVAALLSTSREKAKEIIIDKRVSVDSVLCDKITAAPSACAKISVKGVGRFVLCESDSLTKKGRIVLKYKKYV